MKILSLVPDEACSGTRNVSASTVLAPRGFTFRKHFPVPFVLSRPPPSSSSLHTRPKPQCLLCLSLSLSLSLCACPFTSLPSSLLFVSSAAAKSPPDDAARSLSPSSPSSLRNRDRVVPRRPLPRWVGRSLLESSPPGNSPLASTPLLGNLWRSVLGGPRDELAVLGSLLRLFG